MFKISIRIFLFLLAICSFIGLLSSIYWFFDLFNHFRVQAVIASIILCFAAFMFDKKSLKFATLILIGNLILFAIPILKTNNNLTTAMQADETPMNIVFANVETSNTDYELAKKVLLAQNPDIIALAEIDNQWVSNLIALKKIYPYTVELPSNGNFGMALYSKIPFTVELTKPGTYQIPFLTLDFKTFILIVAHPFPPINKQASQENKHYLKSIANHHAFSNKPVIIAGDLNCTLWGDALKPIIEKGYKRINNLGVDYTFPTGWLPFALQIDHFFINKAVRSKFKVLDYIGSDHYPIQAIIHFTNDDKPDVPLAQL
jgi:endonuclease/exonuclease/phosphatase (EEP) superfamily protein YafD